MSREVDERIVEMQFDNRQFESRISQTINSLDKLTDALKFEGIGGSIRSIQNGINRMDFTPITNGVGALESTLTSLGGRIKLEVFDRLSEYAVDTGEKIFKALTTQGAKAGFAEYETQMGAVQTILANTQHLGTTIDDVNGALANLNEYADLTIYNFSEMTRNIGTFTAAGLDLETSTSAIKGIANLAAISGSTSQQASTAMYQLSQALSAGRVSLQDWNSVVNAGMGGKVFQDALKRTAKHMGIVVDESKSFRDSISGGDTWLSAEVLSETLKQLSGDMDEQALAAQGWSQAEIEEITKMAKTATDAATVVKTFSQLTDTVSEQIGSGWTKTWQLIFGDFEESKALWTGVYKAISPYIDAISDLRNSYLEFWKENEGREKIIEAFSNIWSGVTDVIGKLNVMLHELFPGMDTFGETLVDISDKFLTFTKRFRSTEKVASGATKAVTKMVSSISEAEKAAANAIWYSGKYGNGEERIRNLEAEGLSYEHVQGYLHALIDSNFDAAKADAQFMTSVVDTTKAVDELSSRKTPSIIDNILTMLSNIAFTSKNVVANIRNMTGAIANGIKQAMNIGDIMSKATAITDRVRKLSEMLLLTESALSKISRIARGVFSAFKIVGDVVYGVGEALFDIFGKLFPSLSRAGGNILETAASIGDLVYNFANTHDVATIVHDAIMRVISVFETLPQKVRDAKTAVVDFFDGMLSRIKNATGIDVKAVLLSICDAFSKLFATIKTSTGIDIKSIFGKLVSGLKSVLTSILQLDFKGAFITIADSFNSLKDIIKSRVDNINPESLFGKFISGMKTVVNTITDLFKSLFTSTGSSGGDSAADTFEKRFDVLEWLGGTLSTIGTNLSRAFSFLKELFSELFGFVGGMLTDGINANDSAFEKVRKVIHNIGAIAKDIFTIIAPFAGLGMAKDLTAMPAALAGFVESAGGVMDSVANRIGGGGDSVFDIIERMINSLLKLAVSVLLFAAMSPPRLATATGAMTFLIGELVGSLVIMQKYLKSNFDAALIVAAMSRITSAILKMTLSVVVLSLLNPAKLAVAIGAMTVMIGDLIGALVLMQKFLKADINFELVIATFDGIAGAVMSLAFMTALLALFNPAKLAAATGVVTALVYAITGAVILLQKSYNSELGQNGLKNLGYIAGLGYVIAETVDELADTTKKLAKLDPLSMTYGFLGVTALLAALTGTLYFLSEVKFDDGIYKIVLSMIAVTASIAILSNSAYKLASEGGDKVAFGVIGVYAMIGALAALVELMTMISKTTTPAQILSVSAAMLAAVFALSSLVPVMLILGNLDPVKLGLSLLGLGAALMSLVGAMALLNLVGAPNVLMLSAGLLLLATALSLVTPSLVIISSIFIPVLHELVGTDWRKIGKGLTIVAVGLLAMVVAAPVLALFAVGLSAVGVALTIISVAMAIGASAVTKFAEALAMIAEVWPLVDGIIPKLGEQLAGGIISLITTIIDGFGTILSKIRALAPEIALTIQTVLQSILNTLLSLSSAFANFISSLIIQTLTTIQQDLPIILGIIGNIIDTIINWIGTNIGPWIESLTIIVIDIITGVINGVSARIGEIVNSIMNLAISFFEALANAISTNGGKLLLAIWHAITALLGLLWKGFVNTAAFFESVGGDFLEWLGNGIGGGVFDLVEGVKKIFTEDIPDGLEKIWDKVKEAGGKIITALKDGMVAKAKEVWKTGENIGEWLYDAINGELEIESPSKKTAETGKYFVKGIEKGIEKETPNLNKTVSKTANGSLNTWKDEWGTHSESDETYAMSKELIDGGVSGLEDYGPGLTDTMGSTANDALNAFGDKFGRVGDVVDTNLADLAKPRTVETKIDIIPDVSIDQGNIEKQLSDFGYKSFLSTKTFKMESEPLDFSQFTATSTALSDRNAELEAQRHADVEQNNLKIQTLNDTISKLTESFENGIINIPDNATFTVPVTVDGETIANVTAPYLDVINGEKMNLERSGVTSR